MWWKNKNTDSPGDPRKRGAAEGLELTSAQPTASLWGGGPRVVVSTAAFHARVRGSVPGLGDLKETKMFLPHPLLKLSILESLRYREVACSASDHQGLNFESCVWRAVSTYSSHHPQEVLLAQFSLYVHKSDLKSDSFHFFSSLWSSYSQMVSLDKKGCRCHKRLPLCGSGTLSYPRCLWISLHHNQFSFCDVVIAISSPWI